MNRSHNALPPDLHALLAWEREIPPLPRGVRERALARARAALPIGGGTPLACSHAAPRSRVALAMTAAVGTIAAAGAVGYELGGLYDRVPVPANATTQVVPVRAPTPTLAATGTVPLLLAADAAPPPHASHAEPPPQELLLLGEARSALAELDFAAALVPLGEHARQFEDGTLAEEREALLVHALSGLGRAEEARHVAIAFEKRFPRSALLGAVRRLVESDPLPSVKQ